MDLRDQFAIAALPAIIVAASAGQHDAFAGKPVEMPIADALAIDAYRIADAMLVARQPNPPTSPDKES